MKFTPVQFPNGDAGLAIDITDLGLEVSKELVEKLLFRMKSYGIINGVNRESKRNSSEPEIDKWDKVYAVSNRMLERMPADKAK